MGCDIVKTKHHQSVCQFMNDRSQIRQELAALLTRHQPAIAASWAERIYHHASFRPGETWLEVLHDSTALGLQALAAAYLW